METCASICTRRVILVVVFHLLKSTVAGTFAPSIDADDSLMTRTYLSIGTPDSEETTYLPRKLTTSTTVFTRRAVRFDHSSTAELSDIHPSLPESEAKTATDQSFHLDTGSWTSHSSPDVSMEPLSSSSKLPTITATQWGESSVLTNITSAYLASSEEWQPPAEARTARDLTVTELTKPEITSTDMSDSLSHANSTHISTTVTRAGERTLLAVTSNSTFPYTEDTSSSKTAPITLEGGSSGHIRDVFSTEGKHSDDDFSTNATQGTVYTSEVSRDSPGTQYQTGQPNVTGPGFAVTPDSNRPDSSPPLTGFSSETNTTADSSTSGASFTDSSTSAPSIPPSAVPESGRANMSRHDSETVATETVTGPGSTSLGEDREGPHTHMEETTVLGLTTAPSTPSDVDTTVHESFSSQQPFVPQTDRPSEPTDGFPTATVTVTQRLQTTEEDTGMTSPATVPSTMVASTSTAALITTQNVASTSATASMHVVHTTLATTHTTQVLTTPTTEQYGPTSRTATPLQPSSSSQPGDMATDVYTPHQETSTATPGTTTKYTTAFYTRSAPTSTTAVVTTGRHTVKVPTEKEATTTKISLKSMQTPGHVCRPQSCANGGSCVLTSDHGHRCQCLPTWRGDTCTEDVDECVSSPCPQDSVCVNTWGSFNCECALGYDLEDGRGCTQVKTFLGTFSVNSSLYIRGAGLHVLHREILQLLNASLSILHGYSRSTLRDTKGMRISAVNMFSMSANVTGQEIYSSIMMSLRNCGKPHSFCSPALRHQFSYHVESLCLAQKNRCDTQYSLCNDTYGTPYCQCHDGYFKKNPEDTTCRDCGDGFKLVNGTCVECTFGFGGFNCNNFYGLIAKVVSPAAGGLLLVVVIALIVTCCRKDKNDINKIIFKSGDLQMSPYSDFHKSNRVSMEWGRETIEMQENGSTKNLLQMTDIYYSPALRNADLERNGLYPFSGLPGSRHSCIYPAQWNPSFISDDSRRRDYF